MCLPSKPISRSYDHSAFPSFKNDGRTVFEKHGRPSQSGGVGLVVSEAVDAAHGRRLDVVAQEEAVVTPGPAAGLLQHHHHHGLGGLGVTLCTVPVVSLELREDTRVS